MKVLGKKWRLVMDRIKENLYLYSKYQTLQGNEFVTFRCVRFIYSFSKYLLPSYNMLGIVLGARDTVHLVHL